MRRFSSAAGNARSKYGKKTEVWTRPDCALLMLRMFWKCLFKTSSMAWQNPQMKNRDATMRNANINGLRLGFMRAAIDSTVVWFEAGQNCRLTAVSTILVFRNV